MKEPEPEDTGRRLRPRLRPGSSRSRPSSRRRSRAARTSSRSSARSATATPTARSAPTSSYHHGDDIFGELGQPIVALADGTIFSLGWNKIGGNRLWLRDRQGNAFYYAHLSAFSTLVFNGARVKAGQVIGFMGNTGDAEGTPTHLHFEVHPVSLLYLGYDGAIDPTPFLDACAAAAAAAVPDPAGLGAERHRRQRRAAAGRDPALGRRHLERRRPRPRVAAPRDRGARSRGPRA